MSKSQSKRALILSHRGSRCSRDRLAMLLIGPLLPGFSKDGRR